MQFDEALQIVLDEIARQRRVRVAQVRVYEHEILAHARKDAVGRVSKHDCETLSKAIRQLCHKTNQAELFFVPND